MGRIFSKAAPYMVQQDNGPVREAAKWLRESFKPLMAKRLPTVFYGGFKHGFMVQNIQMDKKEYPYFFKNGEG